ncbi:acyl-CoA dehydrogenase family protein [Diaminobutyricimonas sp. LJ205]|uniref:acyl-CoA dehydrogenase family protein n=1 Tax=Diaminobutyricimonas sp. LJ205 TaxID=2683590 RepID=UPI0012F4F20C|nr:acyl-CoA dehydrogenase family protein [Diaminobutyricimonas sp. LJ205]
MDFRLDEDAIALADMTRAFCEERIVPHAESWDRGETIDPQIFKDLAETGLTSLRIPSENGGSSATFVQCGAAAYEMGRADVGLAIMVVNGVFFGELMHLMSPTVRDKYAPMVAAGSPFAITITEPEAGSDAGSLRTTAERDGDEWVISGEKGSVSYAGLADWGLIFARTGGPGAKGVSLFATDWNVDGIESRIYQSAGQRVTKRGQAYYDNLRIPAENLIGRENEGFREAMQFFDYNRAFLALVCIGAAEKSLAEVTEYVRARQAFGGSLSRFQGVNFPIAEHATKLEAAKLLAYKVLAQKDAGLPHSKEAAMVKWYGCEAAFQALHDCVLLAGWPGFSSDLPHDRRMRDVMGFELGDGTAQIMKMIVAREVIGRESLPYGKPKVSESLPYSKPAA